MGVSYREPLFVCAKDIENNRLIVCTQEELKISKVVVNNINFVALADLTEPVECQVKLRYSAQPQEAIISPGEVMGTVEVKFTEPQNGAACGQAAVFYSGDLVLGGGTIIGAE